MSSTHAGTSPPDIDTVDLTDDDIFARHEGGKLSIAPTVALQGRRDLSIAYTPGWRR